MIGALWTGISGLASHQKALDNESTNIANVNTVGYKSSRISFADQMYQDRIGKGSKVLDAEKLYVQGNLKVTGVSYDMALSGGGFFAVSNTRSSGTSETYYTRAGNFRMGDNGTLQDAAGNSVQGWAMSALDPKADVTTTNSNVAKFTDAYTKLAASQVIKKSTSIETITAKMTDYTKYAAADSQSVFTGAGYKTQSTKIADIEALITSYSTKLQNYKSNPDAVSSPSVSQKSYVDFNIDGNTIDDGDQIYVYIDGTKIAQSFDTDENTTMQKLIDLISKTAGLSAYMTGKTGDTAETDSVGNKLELNTSTSSKLKGKMVIEGLIPGKQFTLGEAAIVHDSVTSTVTKGTATQAVEGTGYGAVASARDALKLAVSGKQRDVWSASDLANINTDDRLKYSMDIGGSTYTVQIQQGTNDITSTPTATAANSLSASLATDASAVAYSDDKVTLLAEAINEDPNMKLKVIAKNINGNLVIEPLLAGEEFSATITATYNQPAATTQAINTATATFSFAAQNYSNGETVVFDNGTNNLTFTVGSRIASYAATSGGAATQITLSQELTTSNIAAMVKEAITSSGGFTEITASTASTTTPTDLSITNNTNKTYALTVGGNSSTKTKNSNYSVNSGGASEFLEMKTTIDQTASKGALQLRLDTLSISDSAFGEFAVDNTGLISMTQDGATFAIGQVAIALFNNERGLEPIGDNLLKKSNDSGEPIFNVNNNKTAKVEGKTLELSTADLSESLVNLMVFQRAFEANAKSITTSDELLNTLINLKR